LAPVGLASLFWTARAPPPEVVCPSDQHAIALSTDVGLLAWVCELLVDRAESRLLSNLGWIDHGSIWLLDIESGEIGLVRLGDGEYVRLHAGRGDLFAAALVSSSGTPWMTVTVRGAAAPDDVRARWEAGTTRADGSPEDWSRVPTVFVGFDPGTRTYVSVSLDPSSGAVETDPLEWFDDSYDWGYQAPIAVCRVPGSDLLLFSVQRSSDLVLYDPRTRRVQHKIQLAGGTAIPSQFSDRTLRSCGPSTTTPSCALTQRAGRSQAPSSYRARPRGQCSSSARSRSTRPSTAAPWLVRSRVTSSCSHAIVRPDRDGRRR
jgi:hypothetical protein